MDDGRDFSFSDDLDPDASFKGEKEALAGQKSDFRSAREKRFDEDTGHRRELVKWVKILIPIYLACMFAVLAFSGLRFFGFQIEPGVLVALLCTTTANVLGLAAIVLRGLFK